MKFRYEVSGEDMSLAGKASGEVKRALGRLGVSPAAIKRTAVCMYEAEMNRITSYNVCYTKLLRLRAILRSCRTR